MVVVGRVEWLTSKTENFHLSRESNIYVLGFFKRLVSMMKTVILFAEFKISRGVYSQSECL